eukprot:TRINITY_DN3852_c0_g1_i1.p1 TRINITY_DN3852_c0_g1~~TRINITY_DN3852_c0_g1_i1.p1  ORF type:complete len:554 (+),score=69.10 TRINITY_DN3852_c0_g1_i1:57-1718(+)
MYPTSLQQRLNKYQEQYESNPTRAFGVLFQWATTLYEYSKKQLSSMATAADDYKVKATSKTFNLQNHLKDSLFAACAKFQEADSLAEFRNDIDPSEMVKLLCCWADSLLLISLYFKLPFFELAIEKYLSIIQKYHKTCKEYQILRRIGTVFAEEAHFSYYTSTTFMASPSELAKHSNDYFTKALSLHPKSVKTLIFWARANERIARTQREFKVVAELTVTITSFYRKALKLKPDCLAVFDSWTEHLDWMISLYFSTREREIHSDNLTKLFTAFFRAFKRAACEHYITLQTLLAFALLDGTTVPSLSRSVLIDLQNYSRVPKVKEEAARHLQFLDEVKKTKEDTYKLHLRSAQQLEKHLPKGPLDRLRNSKLSVEEIAANFDLVLSALWFTADREDSRAPIFHRTRQGGGAKSSSNTSGDNLEYLNAYIKKEDPLTYYKNKSWIGKGAFGDVWTAEKKTNGTLIAMKVLKNSSQDIHHIMKEVEAMKSLSHKNIVAVEDCFHFADTITITMEYCDGGTLRDLCSEVQLVETEIAFFLFTTVRRPAISSREALCS